MSLYFLTVAKIKDMPTQPSNIGWIFKCIELVATNVDIKQKGGINLGVAIV